MAGSMFNQQLVQNQPQQPKTYGYQDLTRPINEIQSEVWNGLLGNVNSNPELALAQMQRDGSSQVTARANLLGGTSNAVQGMYDNLVQNLDGVSQQQGTETIPFLNGLIDNYVKQGHWNVSQFPIKPIQTWVDQKYNAPSSATAQGTPQTTQPDQSGMTGGQYLNAPSTNIEELRRRQLGL